VAMLMRAPLLLADCSVDKAQTIVTKDQNHVIGKVRCDGRKVVSDSNVANDLTSATSCLLTVLPPPMALVPCGTTESFTVSNSLPTEFPSLSQAMEDHQR